MRTTFEAYDQIMELLEMRVKQILQETVPPDFPAVFYRLLPGFLDLTTLEGADTEEKVLAICRQAKFSAIDKSYPDAAAVCVYPSLVKYARAELDGSGILVASVAGGFPSGQTGLNVKLEEIRYAIGEGADEIDTVISRGKLISGHDTEVYEELCAIREACGSVRLKVILETGELQSVELIRKASELAILAGADFLKTSTGKVAVGATPVAFLIMLDTIREYLGKTGKSVGIKASGGVRTPETALIYGTLLVHELGELWLTKDYFRIGTSTPLLRG